MYYKLFEMTANNGLYFVKEKENTDPAVRFILDDAEKLNVDAVFVRFLERAPNVPIPQVYIFDNTIIPHGNTQDISKRVWCSGKVPLTFVYESHQVLIFNNLSKPEVRNEEIILSPIEIIKLSSKVNESFKAQKYSARLLSNGDFWKSKNVGSTFNFSFGSYTLLLSCFKAIRKEILDGIMKGHIKETNKSEIDVIAATLNKLLVLCIFVKYLEERQGKCNDKVFQDGFFSKFNNATCFTDVARNANSLKGLFNFLSSKFVGEIFRLTPEDLSYIQQMDLNLLADFLEGKLEGNQYHLFKIYSFNELPIELISNIYEEFLIDENQQKDGVVYTPPHLVQFLIDETMPLNSPPANIKDFKLLDPACGSGIFLVCAFKRLVQWWIIRHNWRAPLQADLIELMKSTIYGVDKSPDAIKVTAFSLCLVVCELLSPKEIWENLKFENFDRNNLVPIDFFNYKEPEFDLIIGNPPFNRNISKWTVPAKEINDSLQMESENSRPCCPNLALLFFEYAVSFLKKKGHICLIVPTSPLLYNENSCDYRRFLLQHFYISQILDFTHLNRLLFNSRRSTISMSQAPKRSGDISVCALFVQNIDSRPESILHLVVKTTKSAREKMFFEIDYYDFNYVDYFDALENKYIWKANYWGGGRLAYIIQRLASFSTLGEFIQSHRWISKEGHRESKYKNDASLIKTPVTNVSGFYDLQPPELLTQGGINVNKLEKIDVSLIEPPVISTFESYGLPPHKLLAIDNKSTTTELTKHHFYDILASWDLPPLQPLTQSCINISKLDKVTADKYISTNMATQFMAPHILIREVIEKNTGEIPIHFAPNENIVFGERIIGVHCPEEDVGILRKVYEKLSLAPSLYHFS